MELSLKVITIVHNRAPLPDVDQSGQRLYGYVSPTKHPDVQLARRGYRKQWLEAGHRPDTAYDLSPEELTLMVETLDVRSPKDLTDATLLAVGYDLGGRRVELAKLDIGDIELHVVDPDNVVGPGVDDDQAVDYISVHIAMSKTDQAGQGADVILTAHPAESAATCPVRLVLRLLAVLAAAGFVSGPLFRVVRTGGPVPTDGRPRAGKIMDQRIDGVRVELVVARTSKNAGLTGGAGKRKHIVPHSLRAGSATAAGAAGADTPELNAHFRWSDRGTTAQRYVRRGRAKSQNPARRIWKAKKPAG
jgi:integrase